MRRYFIGAVALALLLCTLFCTFGCSGAKQESEGRIRIVCTLFPQYDWLCEIVGESKSVELSLIISNGADPHSYEPTAADIMAISNADMIVYLGAESDKWVSKALERSGNEDIVKVALCEVEAIELHEISSASEGHDHAENDHSHSHHDHGALDEHIWLSLDNARVACEALCGAVSELDPEGAEIYARNKDNYIARLDALDRKYIEAVNSLPEDERFLLFCDRFPFVYLLEDYGVEYAAAFEGCSADADADFETVLRLIKEADAHSLTAVAISESSDGALARTVINSSENKDGEIVVFNSLQSVSKGEIAKGISYISVMEDNLKALKKALGAE